MNRSENVSSPVKRSRDNIDGDMYRFEDNMWSGSRTGSFPMGFENLNTGEMDFFEEIRLSFSMKKQPTPNVRAQDNQSTGSTSRTE